MIATTKLAGRHPGVVDICQWFDSSHLDQRKATLSLAVEALVEFALDELNDGPELTAGLRKLLEAKDCLVRQFIADQKAGRPAPAGPQSVIADLDPPKVSFRPARQGPGVLALQREGDGATAGGSVVVVESVSERGIVLKIEGKPHSIEVRWSAYGFVQTEWVPLDADSGWEMLRDSVEKVLYVRPVLQEYPDPNAVM
jgi:hypothetical protein